MVGRSIAATRQLASRARRRVQGAAPVPDADLGRQRQIVDAFLAASHNGDFEALLAVLDPDLVFRADPVATRMGAQSELRGAAAVAATFKGRAQGARPALVDGVIGLTVAFGSKLRILLSLGFADERIVEINAIADPARLRQFEVKALET